MELKGWWAKDEEGYMDFETEQLQRMYEAITDQYYQVYNRYADSFDDEELAQEKAGEEGYRMVTDYKAIEGKQEFATSYTTPSYQMDMWYETDPISGKRLYDKGYLRILKQ